MPYFDLNIFGTAHCQHDGDLFTFNLHILQVESDLTPTNFDMFIEFYAFPFNFDGLNNSNQVGSQIICDYPTPNSTSQTAPLNNRFSVNRPQVIHLTGLTPNNPIDLYDCNPGQYFTQFCSSTQLSLVNSLPTPCPPPGDIRLFSNTFCVPYDGPGLDNNWTNMTNSSTGNKSFVPNVGPNFNLPISVTIIADGCVYTNKGIQRLFAKIYTTYTQPYPSGNINPYGNVDCVSNQRFDPIGHDDKVRIT